MKNSLLSLPNKTFVFLLAGYVIVQTVSLVIHSMPFYLTYEVLYLTLIVAGIIATTKMKGRSESFREWKKQSVYLLLSGILLTTFYLMALWAEPSFDWNLKPDFKNVQTLLIYFPMVQAVIAVIFILVSVWVKSPQSK